jgi:hypothetical protein
MVESGAVDRLAGADVLDPDHVVAVGGEEDRRDQRLGELLVETITARAPELVRIWV